MDKWLRIACLLSVSLSWGGWLKAQTATSSLRGTVTDPSGAAVAGAEVTLTNGSVGFSRATTTSEQGVYQLVEIPPATYELTVTAEGFAVFKQSNLTLLVNTPATVNVGLRVAGSSSQVEVSDAAPLINAQDATLGHAFDSQQIRNLPFEGRDPTAILSLQAGVVFTGSNAAQNTSFDSRSGAVAGARSDQADITIDGIDNNNALQGLPFQGALRATLDSLQEFRVTTTGGGAADAGHSSGAQVSLLTKSGTNEFHGTLYEYHRPTFTTANDWFNKHKELKNGQPNTPGKLIRNTYGGSLGGPLLKDRFFFFFTYEGQHLRENTEVTRLVPSADLRQGILSYECTGANCPASGVQTLTPAQLMNLDPNCSQASPGFPNGTCPLGPGPNPAVEQYLSKYPLPNALNVGDGFNILGYTFSAAAPANLNTGILKLDYKITKSGNHQVFARGNLQHDRVSGLGNNGPQFPGAPPNQIQTSNPKGLAAGYTAVLRNNLVSNFRYGYVYESLGTSGLQTQPFVDFDKLSSLEGQTPTTSVKVPVHNFAEDVTWIKKNHTLQFGGNVLVINNTSSTNSRSFSGALTNPNALFNSAIANTGSSLDPGAPQFASLNLPAVLDSYGADYDFAVISLTGLIPSVTATYNLTKQGSQLALLPQGSFVHRHFRAHEAEWYAQDAWRVTPNLTLTFGARYTLLQPPYETTGNQVTPTTSMNDFFQIRMQAMNQGLTYHPLIGFDLAGQANGKAPYWKWDYGDVAPRFAFAWSPSFQKGPLAALLGGRGKSSLRGGFGIYHDHFGEGVVNSFDAQGSFGLTSSITNPLAVLTVDQTPRFSGINVIPTTAAGGCSTPPCTIFVGPPSGSLPYFPPSDLGSGGFAIAWGLDDKLKTPYSEVVNLSVQRELASNLALEISYVGRFGHRLLQEEDMAMPLDIRDPQSGMDYFAAAQAFDQAIRNKTPIQNIPNIPFWQNVFPQAAGPASSQIFGFNACAPGAAALAPGAAVTATQAMYNLWSCTPQNDTAALFVADVPLGFPNPGGCFPACATINGNTQGWTFFDQQWASLYGWRSIGTSNYHGLQASLRGHRQGLTFDLNYTFSKAMDEGSNAEYINQFAGVGFASQIVNAWRPRQNYGPSDYDLRHQINANWVYELPFGAKKRFASNLRGFKDGLIGGWQLAGLYRWTSGFPFSILPGTRWATNWQLNQPAVALGALPKTGTYFATGEPNVFQDPGAASSAFRAPFAGESGARNNLRGPGLFDVDASLGKTWDLAEGKKLTFVWEVFNVTNTPRFDVGTLGQGSLNFSGNNTLTNIGSFGNFVSTLSKPRVMEFSLRFTF